jgi:hypothetical protein
MTTYQGKRLDLELNDIKYLMTRDKIYKRNKTIYVVYKDNFCDSEFVSFLKVLISKLKETFSVERIVAKSNSHYIIQIEEKKLEDK